MPVASSDPPLVRHLEDHLGKIVRGVRDRESSLQVVFFGDQPEPGAITYCTLGLSNHLLQSATGREFRMELVGSSYADTDLDKAASNLLLIASELAQTHKALLRGQVVGPRGPIAAGSRLSAYYCLPPVYFPDSFAELQSTDPSTVFVCLVPITHAEAHYIFEHGWRAFEDLLEAQDPDLLDLSREPVRLSSYDQ